ncbi:unnamed protein product, partial [marine sediment metagenome]
LWHGLSAPEQFQWQSDASKKHMTGFAYFMSQCLRPNPGLYLPLQGGTMTGTIEMNGNHIHGLPFPGHAEDPIRQFEYTTYIKPWLMKETCRVYNDTTVAIPDTTHTTLSFNQERWDTDTMHDLVANPERLTARTAGYYLIIANVKFLLHAVGFRNFYIADKNANIIAETRHPGNAVSDVVMSLSTILYMAVNDWIITKVWHDSGAPLNLVSSARYSPAG